MQGLELMGTSVEVAAAGFDVFDPVVDRRLRGAGGSFVASRNQAILRVDGVATFAIADGSLVRVDPEPDAAPAEVSAWLHGSVAALLLAQRGLFALHASVVGIDGIGVAVAGLRGAGKSTTALRIAQRGHTLVTDDVSPLDAAGQVTTRPFARPIHLFADTADRLGIDVSDAEPIPPRLRKLALPEPTAPLPPPVPLGAVVVLGLGEGEWDGELDAVRVRGAQTHWTVAENLYRLELLGDLYRSEMFRWTAAVSEQVAVYLVTRPALGWTVDLVADAVERVATEHRPR